ncbi:MAG TPA: hypothetical protein VN626_02550 [Clostridia bacterium]|nr:hypothetical protein [Clostridia bacterium]
MSVFFETSTLFEALKWLALLLLGLVVVYYRTSTKLQGVIANLIAQAEAAYGDAKAGGIKFEWVCRKVYSLVPVPLNTIITKQIVESLVQSTFDTMTAYAKMQLDKLLDSTMPDIERTED